MGAWYRAALMTRSLLAIGTIILLAQPAVSQVVVAPPGAPATDIPAGWPTSTTHDPAFVVPELPVIPSVRGGAGADDVNVTGSVPPDTLRAITIPEPGALLLTGGAIAWAVGSMRRSRREVVR